MSEASASDARPAGAVGPRTGGRSAPFALALLVLAILCAAGAAALVADTVATVLRLHSPLPYFDEWDSLDLFKDIVTGQSSWTELFSQHNEHRIFFPRLFLYADYLFFGGRGSLNLATIATIQVAHAGLLIWLLRRARPAAWAGAALAAVIVVLMFSLRQEENFTWGFQVQFVGVFAAATLAAILFSDALGRMRAERPAAARFLGAYCAVGIATYSMANGLLAGVALVCLALAARAPPRVTATAAVVTGALAAAYFHGYEPEPGHTPLAFSLQHPVPVVSYVAIYLGNFLDPDVQAARLLGLGGLIAMAGAVLRILRGRDGGPVSLALLGIMLFVVGSALLTAVGRLSFGVDQAFASRYSTGSAAFWSAVLIYWWAAQGRTAGRVAQRGAVALAALVLVAGALRSQRDMKDGMETRAYQQREASDALLLGLKDADSFEAVDSGDAMAGIAAFLKARGLSIYNERDAGLVGHPIAEAGRMSDPAACAGSIDEASIAPDLGAGGLRLSGHAAASDGRPLSGRIYLVDAQNVIAGLASFESAFGDPSAWHGFARGQGGTVLRAVARLGDARLCEMGAARVPS